ncbi:MAG: MOSC domain-containing protein [Gaiellaceae bacterium]
MSTGLPWDDPASLAAVRAVTVPGAELIRYEGAGPQRFDVLPISLATDGGVAAVGVDRRRFRPNILLEGVEGLTEREWPGFAVRLGGAVVGVQKVRSRCVMTTFDPDSLEQDVSVLRRIVEELDGDTALDCFVIEPGRIAIGDEAELLGHWTLPQSALLPA